MEASIRAFISMVVAVLVYIICTFVEKLITKDKGYRNYLEKSRKRYIVNAIFYACSTIAVFTLFYSMVNSDNRIFSYFIFAFITRAAYFIVLNIVAPMYDWTKRSYTPKNELDREFVYMDRIMMVNAISSVSICVLYSIADYMNLLHPFTGVIGSMLMLMALITFYLDSFNIFTEYEKKNEQSIFNVLSTRKWNFCDTMYIKFHGLKYYILKLVRNKAALLIHLVYFLAYACTLYSNFNRL